MKSIIFTTLIVLIWMHLTPANEAFIIKTVSIQKGYPAVYPTIPSSDAAVAAYTASKNALVQTVANAVTEKINAFTNLVNSVVAAKIAAKKSLWTTTLNAGTGVVQSVNGILVAKPTVFTKTVSFGYKPIYTTAIVPVASSSVIPLTTTASTGAVTTTTTGGQSGGYRVIRRSYYA